MSHDRGCDCGMEAIEYAECTKPDCSKRAVAKAVKSGLINNSPIFGPQMEADRPRPPEQDQTQKRDAGKSDPMMIEEDLALALEVANRVLDYGKEKYGTRGGWKQVNMDRYKSADGRHRRDRMKYGTMARDVETKLPHIAHEIVNLMFILQTELSKMSIAEYNRLLKYAPPSKVS